VKIKDKILSIRKLHNLTQADFAGKIGVTRQTVINWEKGSTEPNEVELSGIVKYFDIDVPSQSRDLDSKIPFYDAVAFGGSSKLIVQEQEPVYSNGSEMINPGSWFRTATGALRVYGHSMFPKYPAGSIIAFKPADKDVMLWGEDYVLELPDRRIVKRIEKGPSGYVKAVSYNKSEQYVYDTVEIPVEKIKRLYMVLGKIELETSI
jgi:transcriptional regulator with XRE-family HTH domain